MDTDLDGGDPQSANNSLPEQLNSETLGYKKKLCEDLI